MNANIHIIARQGWIGAIILGVLFLLGVYLFVGLCLGCVFLALKCLR